MKIQITSFDGDGKEIIFRNYQVERGVTLAQTVDEFIEDSFMYEEREKENEAHPDSMEALMDDDGCEKEDSSIPDDFGNELGYL